MHKTAYNIGKLFLENYTGGQSCRVLDVGSMNVNGSLRDFCRTGMTYVGVDLEEGDGVDVVLKDPRTLPFREGDFDAAVSTSTFEHAAQFWLLFLEMARVTKSGGFIYINAPSNGTFHQYPYDFWRFYPDAGLALVDWGRSQNQTISLVESAIAAQDVDIWNDFFAVFQKAPTVLAPNQLIVDLHPGCTNIRRFDKDEIIKHSPKNEDQQRLGRLKAGYDELTIMVNERETMISKLKIELHQIADEAERQLLKQSSLIKELEATNTENTKEIAQLRARLSVDQENGEHAKREFVILREKCSSLETALRKSEAQIAQYVEERRRIHQAKEDAERRLLEATVQLGDMQRKSASSRWLFGKFSDKVIHGPRDISRRIRKSRQKKRRPDHGKYTSSRLLLRFEPILPQRFAERMRRRMEKNIIPLVIRRKEGIRPPRSVRGAEFVNNLNFPNLKRLGKLRPKHRIAVVLHIYYSELWSEIANYLSNIEDGYDLFVSLVEGISDDLEPIIRAFCPDAHITVFPNHGRDVFPFIAFLNSGAFDRYELLLKIHSKLTHHDPEAGKLWRRTLFDGLLGTPERVRGIITSFQANRKLGLVGPHERVIEPGNPNWRWEYNTEGLQWLEQCVGNRVDPAHAKFVAGTMFWLRPAALADLKGCLEATDFDPEPLPPDGMLQHAVERYIGVVASTSGYLIEAAESLPFCSGTTRSAGTNYCDVLSAQWQVIRPISVSSGDRVCLFASYSASGEVQQYTLEYCRRLQREGIKVIFILATDQRNLETHGPVLQVCDSLIVRENAGFDFASWALALRVEPALWFAQTLFFANDSVYGPFQNFGQILKRIEENRADVVSLTNSNELQPHIQSFFFALKKPALASPAVRRFWQAVKILSTKREVIAAYEVALLSRLSTGGLRCDAVFPSSLWGKPLNPTLCRWRKLIEMGFPFVKVELLRDNPGDQDLNGWEQLLREKGYDPQFVHAHLKTLRAAAA